MDSLPSRHTARSSLATRHLHEENSSRLKIVRGPADPHAMEFERNEVLPAEGLKLRSPWCAAPLSTPPGEYLVMPRAEKKFISTTLEIATPCSGSTLSFRANFLSMTSL